MLTWNVTYHCKPAQRTAFYEALTHLGVRENSLGEEGNVKYDYYFDAQNPNDLLLVETWTEPSFQEAHCKTDVFAQLQALKVKFCTDVTIDKFTY
ncbi:MAG: hypothetical protein HFG08_03805 [Oscillibacter sp.]|nr:hypothetical protein [Oscillibacter sp.]